MDSDDEELAPPLVNTETTADEVEESPQVRVPITIVTGQSSVLCVKLRAELY